MEVIKKQQPDGTLELYLSGRIDTNTAPQLREAIAQIPKDTAALTMDFRDVPMITSAGLRELVVCGLREAEGRCELRRSGGEGRAAHAPGEVQGALIFHGL